MGQPWPWPLARPILGTRTNEKVPHGSFPFVLSAEVSSECVGRFCPIGAMALGPWSLALALLAGAGRQDHSVK